MKKLGLVLTIFQIPINFNEKENDINNVWVN